MKAKTTLSIAVTMALCLLAGCGRTQPENAENSSISGILSEKKASPTNDVMDSNESFLRQDEKPDQTPVPKKASISLKEDYSDSGRSVSVLGLKEYSELKGDFGTDKPGKGNIFLALFLEIENNGKEKMYINPYEVNADADGRELENTILVNQPEGYPTIFTNIEPDMSQKGFIVWEVPKGWKKFKFAYTGWKGSDGLTLDAAFTKKNLKNPKKY